LVSTSVTPIFITVALDRDTPGPLKDDRISENASGGGDPETVKASLRDDHRQG
jgi:hypothetical protein